jgi:prophage regulatory protein
MTTVTTTYKLPETGFLRIWHIIGDPEAVPPIPPILPVGRTTFLNRVKDGTYPQPIRLGVRSVAWRVSDIRALIEKIGA